MCMQTRRGTFARQHAFPLVVNLLTLVPMQLLCSGSPHSMHCSRCWYGSKTLVWVISPAGRQGNNVGMLPSSDESSEGEEEVQEGGQPGKDALPAVVAPPAAVVPVVAAPAPKPKPPPRPAARDDDSSSEEDDSDSEEDSSDEDDAPAASARPLPSRPAAPAASTQHYLSQPAAPKAK